MGWDELIATRRTHGRVDEHDGEYVETEFTCLGPLPIPLVPVRSFWIVDDRGSQRVGFEIELHHRSVAAAYLRILAPGIAIAVLALWSSSSAAAIAAALFTLSAWSWTWWPRDAAVRRRSDFDRAAFGSRCDPAAMTDAMHQLLTDQLRLRAGAHAEPRLPDDIVRFGARTPDEALFAYGILRLAGARSPHPPASSSRFPGIEHLIGGVARRLRSRGGPYRDRHAANALELWAALSASAQDSAGDRRTELLRSCGAVPAPRAGIPAFVRKPWIWFAVLAISTVGSGVALWSASVPHPQSLEQQARAQRAEISAAVRRWSGEALQRRPVGQDIAVQCDFVQNSDHGSLRDVALCLLGRRILPVAGGGFYRSGPLLRGHVEEVPRDQDAPWASALRDQIGRDGRYYDFYLRTGPSVDELRRNARAERDRAHHLRLRTLALAASLAVLAGWFVWIRLWLLRRRVATWTVVQ